MIHQRIDGGVAVLRFEHGKVNAIDIELLDELASHLDEVENTRAAAVILTGTGMAFSAGVDLFRILDGGQDYLGRFLTTLASTLVRLYTYPRPVVAAINGHAIAGGCVVACACDYRLMADSGGRIGVTELLVGVPFPAAAFEIMRATFPGHLLAQLVYTGRKMGAAEALRDGLVDEVVAADGLHSRALDIARALAVIPELSFSQTKRQLQRPVIERIEKWSAETEAQVRAAWARPEVLAAIRGYLQQTVGKGHAEAGSSAPRG